MSGFLASVTDAAEALLALEAGADIIDCKDPAQGALGALRPAVIRGIVDVIAGRRPVSATVGDLPTEASGLVGAVGRAAATGVDYVKLGLFRTYGIEEVLAGLSPLARRYRLIAVLFADRAPRLQILPDLSDAGFAGVMLDTAGKEGGTLLDHVEPGLLRGFVEQARALDLRCGLAGSLGATQIPDLLPLGADYLGFRGALCEQGRRSKLSREALHSIRRTLSAADCLPPRSWDAALGDARP